MIQTRYRWHWPKPAAMHPIPIPAKAPSPAILAPAAAAAPAIDVARRWEEGLAILTNAGDAAFHDWFCALPEAEREALVDYGRRRAEATMAAIKPAFEAWREAIGAFVEDVAKVFKDYIG